MSTLKLDTIASRDGTESTDVTNVINGSAKAWVNFNGTGTVAIRDSFNVSSITDNSTGNYTVTFTNALSNANYSAIISIASANTAVSSINRTGQILSNPDVPSTTAVRVQTGINYYSASAVEDQPYVFVAIHR
jgi:hypothetical protein